MTANCTFISSASYYDEDLKKTFLSIKGRYYDHYNRNCRIVVPHSDVAVCVLPGDKFEIAGDCKQDKGVIYVDSISNHITPFLKFDAHVQGKDEARAVLSAVPMSFRYFDLPDPTQSKHGTAKRYSAALKWLESWCGNNPGYIRDCLASISDVIEEEVSKVLDMEICAGTAEEESLSAEIFSRKTTKEIPLAVFRLFRKRIRNDIVTVSLFHTKASQYEWVQKTNCEKVSRQTVQFEFEADDYMFVDPDYINQFTDDFEKSDAYEKFIESLASSLDNAQ